MRKLSDSAPPPGTAGASPSPRLRGEGRGEGAFPQAQTCDSEPVERPPHPEFARRAQIPTSPRKRGEVKQDRSLGPKVSIQVRALFLRARMTLSRRKPGARHAT